MNLESLTNGVIILFSLSIWKFENLANVIKYFLGLSEYYRRSCFFYILKEFNWDDGQKDTRRLRVVRIGISVKACPNEEDGQDSSKSRPWSKLVKAC